MVNSGKYRVEANLRQTMFPFVMHVYLQRKSFDVSRNGA